AVLPFLHRSRLVGLCRAGRLHRPRHGRLGGTGPGLVLSAFGRGALFAVAGPLPLASLSGRPGGGHVSAFLAVLRRAVPLRRSAARQQPRHPPLAGDLFDPGAGRLSFAADPYLLQGGRVVFGRDPAALPAVPAAAVVPEGPRPPVCAAGGPGPAAAGLARPLPCPAGRRAHRAGPPARLCAGGLVRQPAGAGPPPPAPRAVGAGGRCAAVGPRRAPAGPAAGGIRSAVLGALRPGAGAAA